jgi:predicted secreted protein
MNLVLVFIIVFVVVIFMILPFGIKIPEKIEKGYAASAPENPRIGLKILITALISLMIAFFYWYVMQI